MYYQHTIEHSDSERLRAYYERKYASGGYTKGCVVGGVDVSAIYHRARTEACLRLSAIGDEDRVLDAGCGNGALAATIAARCQSIVAIDLAGNALNAEFRQIHNMAFRQMDMSCMAFEPQTFDHVVCVEALEHVLDAEQALAEIYRVLKPGGSFVLTYPTINRTLMKRLRLTMKTPISEHLNEWSYAEVLSKTRAVGFTHKQTEGIAFDFGALMCLKHLGRWPARAMTNLALRIHGFPGNSMFVAAAFTKPGDPDAPMLPERRPRSEAGVLA